MRYSLVNSQSFLSFHAVLAAVPLVLAACSGADGGSPSGGGRPFGSGGAPQGGSEASKGGATTSGGSVVSGGVPATGGSETTGGAQPTGGSVASGGAPAGGTASMGGSESTGGTASMGGAVATGGSASTGGSTSVNPPPGTAINHGVKLVGYGAGTTGGGGSNKVTVSSRSGLEAALKSGVTIMVDGTISGSGMISIKRMSDISVIGVGNNGKFRGVGLSFVETSNIIIQNLSFENSTDDAINIEDTNQAWVDHNTMSTDVNYLECDQGSIKDKYDGQIDIKKNSKNITVSFNYIHDACKAMLLGFSDGKEPDDLVTYHHNRFENVASRLPLIRSANTHVYNNYYKNVLLSGINVRMGANALIENNFFENVDDPILSADSPQVGYWNVNGNLYVPSGPSYTHTVEKQDLIGTVVNGEVQSTTNWKVNYSYTLDEAKDVPATTIAYAGSGKI